MDSEKMRQKAKEKLDRLFDEIENLENRARKAHGERKVEMEERIEELKEKRHDLKGKYEKLRDASEATITDLKDAFDRTADIFEDKMKKIKMRFSKDEA